MKELIAVDNNKILKMEKELKKVKSASTPKKDVTNLKNDLLKKFEIIKDSSEG